MNDDDEAILDAAIEFSVAQISENAALPFDVAEPISDVLLLHGSQGLIENGGLVYFFEMQPPGDPPYSVFCTIYRRIGAHVSAECKEKAETLFPFEDAHADCNARQAFMYGSEEDKTDRTEMFSQFNQTLFDDNVWEKLTAYVKSNREVFFS